MSSKKRGVAWLSIIARTKPVVAFSKSGLGSIQLVCTLASRAALIAYDVRRSAMRPSSSAPGIAPGSLDGQIPTSA
jgi:hypothetical protein